MSVGLVLVALSSFSSPAQAACTSPAGVAGGLEWFSANSKFKYCDGTNWNFVGTGGLWTLTGSNISYSSGNVGIGYTNPVVALDINGSVRINDTGNACNSTYDGTLRFNSSTKAINYCDGTSWKAIAGQGVSSCALQEYTTPGSYSYTVVTGCTNLMLEAYGAGGGAGNQAQGGGGGGSSRIDNATPTTLVLGGGGGGGGYDSSYIGGGGGGGYGKKTTTLSVGAILTIVVGGGGQSACVSVGGAGGAPSGGLGGNGANGGNSTYGGAGGGDASRAGGNTTHGGGGGGGSAFNNTSTTTNGGAGGSDPDNTCGTSTNGTSCGGIGEGGGGGSGLGDVILQGLAGDRFAPGTAANGGPGVGAASGTSCPSTGGDGKVVIRPL